MGDIKHMTLRRDDRCACGQDIAAGTPAGWDRTTRLAVCPRCLGAPATTRSQTAPAEQAAPVDIGEAGGSLQREFEKRVARRHARVHERHPRIGGLILALTEEPQSTKAFRQGAIGEQKAADSITGRCPDGVLFLLNRRLGEHRRDGDIDMIAVTSAGVNVIDVKRRENAKVEVRRSGGLLSPVTESLYINNRNRTALLDSLARQLEAVRFALHDHPAGADVNVSASLCFVDAELPVFGTPVIGGVALRGPKRTARMLSGSTGPLDAVRRADLHAHLAAKLPPAD